MNIHCRDCGSSRTGRVGKGAGQDGHQAGPSHFSIRQQLYPFGAEADGGPLLPTDT